MSDRALYTAAHRSPRTSRARVAGRGLVLTMWLAGLALLVARFAGLDEDPWPVGWSGDLLTDEGWFFKAALLKARFGFWTVSGDFNAVTHNALHTLLVWLAFQFGGVSIVSARAVCTGLYAVGAVALAVAFGRRLRSGAAGGLLLCLIGGHFLSVVYTRLAFTDVSATGMSMLALAAWFAAPRGRVAPGHLLAAGLAGGALLCKASYLPVWAVLGMALLLRLLHHRPPAGRWLLAAGVVSTPIVVLLALRAALPVDWVFFQNIIASQLEPMTPAAYASRCAGLVMTMAAFLAWRFLGVFLVGGLLVLGLVRKAGAHRPPSGSPALTHERRDVEPWLVPLALLAGMLLQTAVTNYWPPRRLLLVLPLASMVVAGLWEHGRRNLRHERFLLRSLGGLVGLAVLVSAWGPQVRAWNTRPRVPPEGRHTFAALARSLGTLPAFGASPRPVLVAGNSVPAMLALYLPTLQPVDYLGPIGICQKAETLQVRFFVLNERLETSEAAAELLACPFMPRLRVVGSQTLVNDYRQQGQTFILERPGS